MGTYLGLDSSTQSLSALVIDTDQNKIVYEKGVNFGTDLPGYNSPNGFIENDNDLIRHADPMMWIAAMDLLFTQMKADGFDFSKIDCVSGSGQQHGSVYLNEKFLDSANWNNGDKLVDSLSPMLSRKSSPIWMDSSTSAECAEIAEAVGGNAVVCKKSGSIAIERFTGPQIRKFYKDSPEEYKNTAVIHLVSSFMASVLAGKSVQIDLGDGAGMNLLDLATAAWDEDLANATAPELLSKLPDPVLSNTVAGTISKYFVKKYGFKSDCKVNVWSGDNPNSLVGLGGSEPGTVVISLGTSDTFMAAFDKTVTDPNGFGHVFCNPAGGYMCLICFKNGSLAREKVKEEFNLSWKEFDLDSFTSTVPGNNGNMMVPFYFPETTPLVLEPRVEFKGENDFTNRQSSAKAVRAIVEAQISNMKIHSDWTKVDLKKIKVTGGASRCNEICQIIANIFQAPVERFSVANSAGLGSAMRAANADTATSLYKLADNLTASSENTVFKPDSALKQIYDKFVENLKKLIGGRYPKSSAPI
jgi:xylulokinase